MADLKVVTKPANLPTLNLAQPQVQPTLNVVPAITQGPIASVGTVNNQQPIAQKMSLQQFGQSIKQKYPQYEGVDDTELAQKVLEKYPQYQSKVDLPTPEAPPDTTGDRSKGFFGRLGDDLKRRYQNLQGSSELVNEGKQGNLGFAADIAGQIAGGVGDVIGEGLTSAYRITTPKPVQKVIASAGDKIAAPLIKGAIDLPFKAIPGGASNYEEFKQEHPVGVKKFEDILNIAQFIPVSKAVGLAKRATGAIAERAGINIAEQGAKTATQDLAEQAIKTGAQDIAEQGAKTGIISNIADKFGNVITKRELNQVAETINPILNKTAKIASLEKDLGEAGGVFKSNKLLPSAEDYKIANTVKDIIKVRDNPIKNIGRLNKAIVIKAEAIGQGLKNFKGIVSPKQFKAAITGIEKPVMVASDTTLNNAYDRVVAKAVSLVEKQPGTLEGLWSARKEFDQYIKQQFPKIFEDVRLTPINSAVEDIRTAWNNYIADRLPEGNAYKAQLNELSDIYKARRNLAAQGVGELGANKFTKVTNFISRHPALSAATFFGFGSLGAALWGVLTNPVALATVAAGGTLYYAGKAITSITMQKAILKILENPKIARDIAAQQILSQTLKDLQGTQDNGN